MSQIYVEYSENIALIRFKEILKLINANIAKIVEVLPNRCNRDLAYVLQ
jgi:hypothetical protein